MPRGPRLDIPGMLYHIICRGIDRGDIFKDDKDYGAFLSRLGAVLKDSPTLIYAFALIPNHFHLLLIRGGTPISKIMQRLLTGYAIYFNRRHRRAGHLFQNRYKAVLCDEDTYLLELVRYIHLNPLRAGLVESARALELYPYSGHAYIVGKKKANWYSPDAVLSYFGSSSGQAKRRYLEFIADGASRPRRTGLSGGGLKRSLGYPKDYPKERVAYDERILGAGSFVEAVLGVYQEAPAEKRVDFDTLLLSACSSFGVTLDELRGSARIKRIADARSYFAFRASKEVGLAGSEIARQLNTTRSAVSKMLRRGEQLVEAMKEE